jgi:hypothetical protein
MTRFSDGPAVKIEMLHIKIAWKAEERGFWRTSS